MSGRSVERGGMTLRRVRRAVCASAARHQRSGCCVSSVSRAASAWASWQNCASLARRRSTWLCWWRYLMLSGSCRTCVGWKHISTSPPCRPAACGDAPARCAAAGSHTCATTRPLPRQTRTKPAASSEVLMNMIASTKRTTATSSSLSPTLPRPVCQRHAPPRRPGPRVVLVPCAASHAGPSARRRPRLRLAHQVRRAAAEAGAPGRLPFGRGPLDAVAHGPSLQGATTRTRWRRADGGGALTRGPAGAGGV